MTTRIVALVTLITAVLVTSTPAHAGPSTCGGVLGAKCGVGTNPGGGNFHGLIAVGGAPWVLAAAASSGTEAGCGDCTWSIVLACATNTPTDPEEAAKCTTAAGSPICPPDELLYRLYLTTDAVIDQIEGTVCIGGTDTVIDISDIADADIDRYLRNVVPPDLIITTRPRRATLAGLPTYFSARPPADLTPAPFGGDGVTETITIAPGQADWQWGDGDATGWVPSDATQTHTYIHGGQANGHVTVRWGATYTVTYAGETFGPYTANGQLTKQQDFALPILTSSPVLTSK